MPNLGLVFAYDTSVSTLNYPGDRDQRKFVKNEVVLEAAPLLRLSWQGLVR